MLTITISSLFHKDELYLWILKYDENICVYMFLNEKKLLLWTSIKLKTLNSWKNSRPYNKIKRKSNCLRADYQRPNTLTKICSKSHSKIVDEIRVLELHFSFSLKKKEKEEEEEEEKEKKKKVNT